MDRPTWRQAIDDLIESRARMGEVFGADDIRADAEASGITLAVHPNCWGRRFSHAAERGVIQAVGTANSRRTVRRGLQYRWIGTSSWRHKSGGDAG